MNQLWKRAAFGLFALLGVAAILVVGYGPGPSIERERPFPAPPTPVDAGPPQVPCAEARP